MQKNITFLNKEFAHSTIEYDLLVISLSIDFEACLQMKLNFSSFTTKGSSGFLCSKTVRSS